MLMKQPPRSLTSSDPFRRQSSAEDTCANLLERHVPGCRRVVAERRKAAVVGRAQLLDRDIFGRFKDAVSYLLGRLDARVDR